LGLFTLSGIVSAPEIFNCTNCKWKNRKAMALLERASLQKSDVPFSVYDSDGPSFASTPLSDALEDVRKSAGGSLTETEASDLSKKPTTS
jgi:hypothetical protein